MSSKIFLLLSVVVLGCSSSDDAPATPGPTDTGSDTHSSSTESGVDGARDSADDVSIVDSATTDSSESDTHVESDTAAETGDDAIVDTGTDAAECAVDGDCRAFPRECDRKCECLPLSSRVPDPVCPPSELTACLVNPCMKLKAACSGGKCVTVAK